MLYESFISILLGVTIAVMEHDDKKQLGYETVCFILQFQLTAHH